MSEPLTREQIDEVKQEIIAEIGDFNRPDEEIRNPWVRLVRAFILSDAEMRAQLATAQREREAMREAIDEYKGRLFSMACSKHGNDPVKSFYCCLCGKPMAHAALGEPPKEQP